MASQPIVSATDLTVRFDERVAVDGVSFTIAPGECYGLLGPNGAGKTSTISALCGLRRPDAGTVRIDGHDPAGFGASDARRQLGYVPQEIALFPELTLGENLSFWARLTGVGRRARKDRVREVLDHVGLLDRIDDLVSACSGGMQRRANLAAALLHRPRVLVLDEPTVGVDPHSRNRLLDLVEGVIADGTAVLYTSHYMDEIQRVCDRVGIMDHGRMIAEGTVSDLLAETGAANLEARFLELTGTALRD